MPNAAYRSVHRRVPQTAVAPVRVDGSAGGRPASRAGALLGHVLLLVCALLLAGPGAARAAAAEARHALVIGNGSYPNMPLSNPGNDAQAVARALQRAGFDVDLRINANQRQMDEALRVFGDKLRDKGVGLFYYAGHGVQIKGRNFLMPVGAEIQREDEVAYKAVDVQQVLDKMETAKNRINMVVLDACRDNPFARASRSGAGGLSQLDAPIGSLVAFALTTLA